MQGAGDCWNMNAGAVAGSALDQLLMRAFGQAAVLDVQPRFRDCRDWLAGWRRVFAVQASLVLLSWINYQAAQKAARGPLGHGRYCLEPVPGRGTGRGREGGGGIPLSMITPQTGLPTWSPSRTLGMVLKLGCQAFGSKHRCPACASVSCLGSQAL